MHDLDPLIEDLVNALLLYGKPESYHAIFFYPDPPCGEFMEDFSDDHNDDFYQRAMPGKAARAVLKKHYDTLMPILERIDERNQDEEGLSSS